VRVDGTDVLLVYEAAVAAVERARSGDGPQALEALTLRGHGHAAHDAAAYVPGEFRELFDDPIERLEARLRLDGLRDDELVRLREAAAAEVAAGLAEAEASPDPDPATLEDGVYATPLS
jgi:pyruvate dehydrogenase E1 component alpha subunit